MTTNNMRDAILQLLPDGGEFVNHEVILGSPKIKEDRFMAMGMLGSLCEAGVLEVEYPEEGAPSGRYRRARPETSRLRMVR